MAGSDEHDSSIYGFRLGWLLEIRQIHQWWSPMHRGACYQNTPEAAEDCRIELGRGRALHNGGSLRRGIEPAGLCEGPWIDHDLRDVLR